MMNDDAVYESFHDSLSKLWNPLPAQWPTVAQLTEAIRESVEFKRYSEWRKQRPIKDCNRKLSDDDVVTQEVALVILRIEERWISSQYNAGVFEEKDLLANCTSPFTTPYLSRLTLLHNYFQYVSNTLINMIYQSGKIYDLDALHAVIPFSSSVRFCRDYIMLSYMERMEGLKPRGMAWCAQMELLRPRVARWHEDMKFLSDALRSVQ